MKLTNLLQLTDRHPFTVVRYFALSPLDMRMITEVYQPIVGAFASALYYTLCSAVPADQVGRSRAAWLSQLFLTCGLEPNEQGRKRLAEETAKLEAAGLLQSFRLADEQGDVARYEFRVEKPLAPGQFFDVHHLWFLLKERLGPGAAEALRASFFAETDAAEDEGFVWEDISASFSEVYRLTVPHGSEEAALESASGSEAAAAVSPESFGTDGFRCDELLRRFPRSSKNRGYVEQLQHNARALAEINFYAGKFALTLKETVSLLDEESMFLSDGSIDCGKFEARAGELFKLSDRRGQRAANLQSVPTTKADLPAAERAVDPAYWLEVPKQFEGQCDAAQYNTLLANAPYAKVLKWFFHPAAVPTNVQDAFVGLNVNQRLPDEVINVMVHYLRVNNLNWTKKYIEAIGGNAAGKRVTTFEDAVTHFREEEQARAYGGSRKAAGAFAGNAAGSGQQAGSRKGRPASSRKPVIPVVKPSEGKSATETDIRRILEKAKQLKEDR